MVEKRDVENNYSFRKARAKPKEPDAQTSEFRSNKDKPCVYSTDNSKSEARYYSRAN